MKTQNHEEKHFETALDTRSYLFILILICSFILIGLNIYNLEHKKTEAPTSVTHNINL